MDEILYRKLIDATRSAFTQLFKEHDEHYYYCTLVTTGDGACPYISAWSHEALSAFMEKNRISENERSYYEWSYADSPYCAFGWDHFKDIAQYVNEHRSVLGDDASECNKWLWQLLDTMEQVMRALDGEKLFGSGRIREKTLINAEVMPPDHTNAQRALRLNQKEHIRLWLKEASESECE